MIIQNEEKSLKEVKVSIGLPVYNGERFIRKKIESILKQTIGNFELIISDNGSTDKTIELIEDFTKKDRRIRFFKHEQNMGVIENFNFVLQQAKGGYFMWTAVDDIQMPTFIEKNLEVLEKNSKVACSISKIQLYGDITNQLRLNQSDLRIIKFIKKFKNEFGHIDSYSASGPYEKRVNEYFKNLRHNHVFYGVYRIEQIRNAFVKNSFIMNDSCTTFNILKFGELYVIDEILLYVYDGGMSRKGMLGVTKQMQHGLITMLFPMYPFTKWCKKNLGFEIIMKNLGFFIKINCIGEISIIVDLMRKIKNLGLK